MSSADPPTRFDNPVTHPEPSKPAISVAETPSACVGAATCYVLRCIAHHAGTFAPKLQGEILDELRGERHGSSLFTVERWFAGRGRMLHWLGYHLRCRRMASPTHDLLAWIEAGCGYRGAVLATRYERLHPDAGTDVEDAVAHAAGVVLEAGDADGTDQVVVVDPWSCAIKTASSIRPALDLAHAERGYQALAFHWIGWS